MKLRNTMSGELEELVPVVPGKIGIYVCGVTPYDSAHVGHAMSLIVYDVLVRYLRWRGLEVTYVSNYTDVDDKLIDRGAMLGVDPLELANQNIAQWEDEQTRLGLMKPDVRPRVTQEIGPIIAMTQEIVDHGYGYVTPSGDVYYRVRAKADYGKLSHRNIEDLRTGTRFEPGEEKEFPLDFALWKSAKPGEPAWDSPWGKGRPGWHIECSAMSRTYLYSAEGGERFDIHGGGLDLIFPHHENEIAQAEAAAHGEGQVFARLWMHNGMVQRDGEKMSKSIGNVVSAADALERWSPDAIRLYVLNSHYRAATNLTDEAMAAATAAVRRLANALEVRGSATAASTIDVADTRARFVEAMENDLGAPQALAVLFELARTINRARDAGEDVRDAQAMLRELAGVLGLALSRDVTVQLTGQEMRVEAGTLGVEITHQEAIARLVAERTEARASKNWARADEIRDELDALGVMVEDTPQGPVVRPRR